MTSPAQPPAIVKQVEDQRLLDQLIADQLLQNQLDANAYHAKVSKGKDHSSSKASADGILYQCCGGGRRVIRKKIGN